MRIQIYDTTLRDGTQSESVAFSVEDKLQVARKLDELGVDYIEGGWPGSNEKDAEFFLRAASLPWNNAKLAAFGSTAHAKNAPEEDSNLQALLAAGTPVVTLQALRPGIPAHNTAVRVQHTDGVVENAGHQQSEAAVPQTLVGGLGYRADWFHALLFPCHRALFLASKERCHRGGANAPPAARPIRLPTCPPCAAIGRLCLSRLEYVNC